MIRKVSILPNCPECTTQLVDSGCDIFTCQCGEKYTRRQIMDMSNPQQHLEKTTPARGPLAVELYDPYYDAPEEVQEQCRVAGGDEDWIAIYPPDHPHVNPVRNEFGEFCFYNSSLRATCDMQEVVLKDGRIAIVGTHG